MTEEQKQALIEYCKEEARLKREHIARLEKHMPGQFNLTKYQTELQVAEIALAALTAQPVVSPYEWVHIRFTDRSKNQRMKCQIAWSDSLNSVIYDEEGAPLLISNSAYEVQE